MCVCVAHCFYFFFLPFAVTRLGHHVTSSRRRWVTSTWSARLSVKSAFFFFCSGLAAAEPNRSSLWVRSVSCQWFLFFSQKQRKWNNSFHPGDESRGRRGDFRVQQNRTQNSEPQLRIERDIYYISVFDSDVSSCVQAPNRQAAAGRRNTN